MCDIIPAHLVSLVERFVITLIITHSNWKIIFIFQPGICMYVASKILAHLGKLVVLEISPYVPTFDMQ